MITDLCKLYGVQKLRTSSYHTQMNGQVERMNQTLMRLIGKLDEDKKACWSQYLPDLLLVYKSTRSAVTGYSPHFLFFGQRPQIPADYQFPTVRDPSHTTKLEESVTVTQKRLKEAFAMARRVTSEEAMKQQRYYYRKAGAVALQPGDIVMVHTDRFVGKRKSKDCWQEGGYVVVEQLLDWPIYKVKCPPSTNKRKSVYQILHWNCLMLVPPKEDKPQDPAALQAVAAIVLNADIEPFLEKSDSASAELAKCIPTWLSRPGGDLALHAWLNGEFRSQLQTQTKPETPKSPPDEDNNGISDPDQEHLSSESEEVAPHGFSDLGLD